jgi:hypothetical protein
VVTGKHLDAASQVCFDLKLEGIECARVNAPASTKLVVRSPSHLDELLLKAVGGKPQTDRSYPALVFVKVGVAFSTNVNDTKHPNFDFLGPQLTGVEPTTGPLDGGNKVTITGVGFQGSTDVWFRLAKDHGRFSRLLVGKKAVLAANGKSITISHMPDLSKALRSAGKGTYTFDVAVDVGNAENPANSQLDRYKATK